MPDWGEGWVEVDGKPECREHGSAYLYRYITDEDVGATGCVACESDSELARDSYNELRERWRGEEEQSAYYRGLERR